MKTDEGYGGWRSRPAPVGLYVYDVNGDEIGKIVSSTTPTTSTSPNGWP
jgi:hypothetical protein